MKHTVTASLREVCSPDDIDDIRRKMLREHPLVWTRGDGTKALIIGSTADEVVGMSRAEGRALLARLLDWAAQPAFTYRHHWQEGDCVIWDNPSALHRVIPYALDSGRRMHRTGHRRGRSGGLRRAPYCANLGAGFSNLAFCAADEAGHHQLVRPHIATNTERVYDRTDPYRSPARPLSS